MAFMLVKGCGVGTQIAMYSCIGAGLFCLLCYRFKKCYACGAPRPQGGGAQACPSHGWAAGGGRAPTPC